MVRCPGFADPPHARSVNVGRGQREVVVDFALESSGEVAVRGPLVNERGESLDLHAHFETAFFTLESRYSFDPQFQLFAICDFEGVPRPVVGDEPRGVGAFGRLDVEGRSYEIELRSSFRGTLVLARDRRIVGRASIDDLTASSPLVVDTALLGPPTAMATLVVAFVDANTGVPVVVPDDDLELRVRDAPQWRYEPLPPPGLGQATSVREFRVPVGRVSVAVHRRGFVAAAPEVEFLQPEERCAITLSLVRADAGIRGRVLIENSKPDADAMVDLYQLIDGRVVSIPASVWTNPGGFFEIAGLANEEYVVVTRGGENSGGAARVRATSPPPEVEIQMASGAPVRFHFTDALDARARDRTACRIFDSDGVPVWEGGGAGDVTRAGHERIKARLLPGHYRILVSSRGCREATREFDVPAPDTIEIPLELER